MAGREPLEVNPELARAAREVNRQLVITAQRLAEVSRPVVEALGRDMRRLAERYREGFEEANRRRRGD